MEKNCMNWMLAAILTISGIMTLGSCKDNNEINEPVMTPEEELSNELTGVWVDSTGGEGCAYGIFEDGRFVCYTTAVPLVDGGQVEMDSVSGTWTALVNIPNRWDSETKEPLQGLEVTFSALSGTNGDGLKVDTLIVEKAADGGYLLMWASEIDHYAAQLAPDGMTRGFWKNLWNTVKDTVTRTFKKIAYPVANFFETVSGGFKQRIVKGYADWMGTVYGDVNPKVCEMTIPGTHDSYTYNYSKLLTSRGVKTQGLDISKQWDAGVRCFDVRMDHYGKTLGMFHGPFYLGVSLNDGLNMIRNQLRAHPKETAVVILKFENGGQTLEDLKTVYNIVQRLKKEGYVANPKPDIRLNECRGKMMFIQRYRADDFKVGARATGWSGPRTLYFYNNEGACIGSTGLWAGVDESCTYTNNKGESLSNYFQRKKTAMTKMFEKAASAKSSENLWCFNGASGYYAAISVIENNPSQVAHEMNPWVKNYLDSHKGKKAGFVDLDFAGTSYCPFGYTTNGHEVMRSIINNNVDLRNNQVISLE